MEKQAIYLDYAATTPIDEEVKALYEKRFNCFASFNSVHKEGEKQAILFNYNKQKILDHFKLSGFDLCLTQNATMANNLAILGYLKDKCGTVITSNIEHPSVRNVFDNLKEQRVLKVKTLEDGTIDINDFKSLLTSDTIFVSVMHVNNITGAVQPIKAIIEILKNYPKVKLHVDMVQSLGKIKIDFNLNDIDFFTFSLHKIYGPKGIGGLFYKKKIPLLPVIYGSGSINNLLPGTQDALNMEICAFIFGKYCFQSELIHTDHVKKLWYKLFYAFNSVSGVMINSVPEASSFYIFNISVLKYKSATLTRLLSDHGFMVSAGSACSSKKKTYDNVIYEIFKDEKRASSSIRISLSHLTTGEEIEKLINFLKESIL